jgi:hypothetical protein
MWLRQFRRRFGIAKAVPRGKPAAIALESLEDRVTPVANLTIDVNTGVFPHVNFVDPNATAGGLFGHNLATLPSDNVVVTAPDDTVNGVTDAGAVYLFNGQTGDLISSLTGSSTNDQVGIEGITVLTNGNYLVNSPYWNNDKGAVTWASGTAGVSGVVSVVNSLVGSQSGDEVGGNNLAQPSGTFSSFSEDVCALSNGNYVVGSPDWNDYEGAATWGNGTTGTSGSVSISNSLVGTQSGTVSGSNVTGGDQVGWSITPLSNGNYVVYSQDWDNYTGAATWSSGTAGITGTVSSLNSLVGYNTGGVNNYGVIRFDQVVPLTNGNYVVASGDWNNNEGAATWGNGTSGINGTISASNSLVGSNPSNSDDPGDMVGFSYLNTIAPLANGNYVVSSPYWNHFEGAVTWGNGTTGITGTVSESNSLIGPPGYANVFGLYGAIALNNGNYVVGSTWGKGATGSTGIVSVANSLVGNQVGGFDPAALTNGNYLVLSRLWNGEEGAATLGNGNTGTTGIVSPLNSLVGVTAAADGDNGDEVGYTATPLTNGNYVVASPYWNDSEGAATWGNGTTGIIGTVSPSNSLVGSTSAAGGGTGDQVGFNYPEGTGIIALSNGNYIVATPDWNNNVGAVTWGNGTTGVSGTISVSNSLVGGTTGDEVGSYVLALGDGNYVVNSPGWNGSQGAVTWGNGANGSTFNDQNTIDQQNSLEGTAPGNSEPLSKPVAGPVTGSFLAALEGTDSQVALGFTDPNLLTSGFYPGQSLTAAPDFLTNTLETGSPVTVQVDNTISIASPILVTGAQTGGALTLVGSNILLDSNINTNHGALTLGGTVSPEGSQTLTAGTVSFESGSTYATQLGSSPLQVTGTLNLANASLEASSNTTFAYGQTVILIKCSTSIATTFAGLPQGSMVTAGGQQFKISYLNDEVTLTEQSPMPRADILALPITTKTITIFGSGFSPIPVRDTVAFNLGAAGKVTKATATALTVTLTTAPTGVGELTAVVTTNGSLFSTAEQVATVTPVVTPSTAVLGINAASLTINGFGFDTNLASDRVTFSDGIQGLITAGTANSLSVELFGSLGLGALAASVQVDGLPSSKAVEICSVNGRSGRQSNLDNHRRLRLLA